MHRDLRYRVHSPVASLCPPALRMLARLILEALCSLCALKVCVDHLCSKEGKPGAADHSTLIGIHGLHDCSDVDAPELNDTLVCQAIQQHTGHLCLDAAMPRQARGLQAREGLAQEQLIAPCLSVEAQHRKGTKA